MANLTPHNEAKLGEIAPNVIMPGDPIRSKYIADKFLTNARLVNNVRGVQGYTGTYNGKAVTVMASGMGNASMGIYAYELYKFYNVEKIIRVGTAGTYLPVKLKTIVLASSCFTFTNFNSLYSKNGATILCGKTLLNSVKDVAQNSNVDYIEGTIFNTDTFYDNNAFQKQIMESNNLLAVEMETAALYNVAQSQNKQALTICCISDNLKTDEHLLSSDRVQTLDTAISLALNSL